MHVSTFEGAPKLTHSGLPSSHCGGFRGQIDLMWRLVLLFKPQCCRVRGELSLSLSLSLYVPSQRSKGARTLRQYKGNGSHTALSIRQLASGTGPHSQVFPSWLV